MKNKGLQILEDYLVLTFACFVFAFAWESFMIPNGMSAGGLMGLCTVIQYATGGFLDASVSYIVINVILILISVLIFGIGFGFRSLYCIGVSTLMMQLVSHIPAIHCLAGQFFYVREPFLVPVIAGILEAVGVGLIIRKGGSTGGTDIVALVIHKYWPVSLSKVFLITDFIIICSLLTVPGKCFADMVYGLEMMVAFSLVIDTVVGGQKTSMQLFVFSRHYDSIADYVIHEMDRGATVLHAQGWFSKKEIGVLMLLVRRNELPALTSAIKRIDPKAFMSVSDTRFVYGEGFEEIKAGIGKKKKSSDNATEK